MAETEQRNGIPARLWVGDLGVGQVEIEDKLVGVEIESENPNEVALHTMIDGRGSMASYYFDRESAIALAADLLRVVRLGREDA